ncbi:amidase [Rhizodiscina lignyota]|uniref:amidase n=1 Tax=Rhizodiscina lignyota TaxID=1504668 RepID=A0A9P4I6K6_9PEZI|nr:amidase [Rhizodiscina lignyota]
MEPAYISIARRKQEEQRSKIPKEWLLPDRFLPTPSTKNVLDVIPRSGLLTDQERRITEDYDATALLEALKTGKLKSVDVTRAFCKRAAIAHQLTNCLTEINFAAALSRAASLDAHLARHGSPTGPLHGLPMSIKDSFQIPGLDATVGLTALAFKPSTIASDLTALLLDAGAVIHCKTNIPQTLSALDSHNYTFGRVLNPYNRLVTAGGSSGGEGALIGLRGSPLGVGTDVGGSIRVPAMCNGIYGIKPSCGRVPYGAQQDGRPEANGRMGIQACAGPLAGSLRDCETFLKAIGEMKPWERSQDVLYGSWEEQGRCSRKMRIGVVRRDGLIEPLPPVQKLIDEVAQAMGKSGSIEVVEMDISEVFSKAQSLSNALLGIEGGNSVFDLIESTGEPLSPWLQTRMKRKASSTLEQARVLQARRLQLENKFLQIWKDAQGDIDSFICPIAPHPVPPIDRWNGVSYTITFNLIDLPAGVIPIRTFTSEDMRDGKFALPPGKPIGSWDARNRELWTDVDKSVYLDTPMCIQVVAPKLQEKRLYEAMQAIDEAVKPLRKTSGLKANL